MKMPDKPIFTKKTDEDKRIYYTGYTNRLSTCVLSHSGKNLIFEGNPKINLRKGNSKFGDELFIELLCSGKIKVAPKNSKYDSIEIYFPKNFGIIFLKDFINFVEKQ